MEAAAGEDGEGEIGVMEQELFKYFLHGFPFTRVSLHTTTHLSPVSISVPSRLDTISNTRSSFPHLHHLPPFS